MVEVETPRKVITLESLADGAASELWFAALTRVLENIQDPNTDHKAKRAITLTFDFTADEDRNVGNVGIQCSTKLAGVKGVNATVFFGRVEGELVAVEQPRQQDLFPNPNRRNVLAVAGAAQKE